MTGRYILKIAKKVVLRELKPEIAEKERSEKEKKEDATEEGVPKWQEGRVTMLVLNMVDKTGNNVSVQRGSDV